ncbi:unnamed protein product [Paramecium octaurelia]|uniref:Uncharacterized protein n=1 Tax=Paramecium octaurelia TaxID=43137 RepID=A0A8S1WFN8_PAROT|nr:unnamed protein product [Paramecium octaurelia]
MNKQKQPIISPNWINEIQQASDPLTHSQMYIKHLSDVLLSHNKTLKIRLEIYEKEPITYSQITKAIASNRANDKLNDQNTQQKPNQHKTNQGNSKDSLQESLGPAIEQIKELQKVIEELKKQNIELHEQMKQKLSTMKQAKIVIPHKFEGHDYVGDQLLIGKSTLVNVKKISYEPFHKSSLNQQNSSKDKQIQNLINQKKYLEQEILHFKETGIIRKPKLEGQDLESIIKRYEKNKSMAAAQEKFNKQIRQQEDLKDQYLQALIEETFLLQQQLRLMTQSKS